MLFEAQLLFQLPLTLAMYSPVLAPFFSLFLIAAFIGIIYLMFQTHVGRNILGLMGGAALINFFLSDPYREQRRNHTGYYAHLDPHTPSYPSSYQNIHTHHPHELFSPSVHQHSHPPSSRNVHTHNPHESYVPSVHQHSSQENRYPTPSGRMHGHH